jgi:hypothetical protein
MASLTQVSIATRKTIRYGIYTVIALIIARYIFLAGVLVYRYFFPVPPPAPEISFGKLPVLPFPVKTPTEGLSFSLETPEGGLPSFSYQAKVFYMPKVFTGLLSLDLAKDRATKLGFSPDGAEVTETVYKFPHPKSPSELQISIATGVFSISYNLSSDPGPLQEKPTAPEVAASKVRSYLSTSGLLPKDMEGASKSEYVKLVNDKIIGAISLSDANFVKVNLFRKEYDSLPSMTPDPTSGNIWFIVSGATEKEKLVIAAEYHYFPVDETKSSTYPIKTSQVAWNEFTAGKAYIASLGTNQAGKNIVIRRMYLGYYDGGTAMDFYQPIVVFEGDNGFVAYLPAVTADQYGL